MNRDVLIALLRQKGICSPDLVEKFDTFCDEVLETNRSFNLTAITDRDEFYAKHFVDSLAGYDFVKDANTVCDIGSGAGFPGIPLALTCPNTQFSLVDSLRKRVDFINTCTKKLNLDNCSAFHARAEEFCASHREAFDVCTARAVSSLATLAELCAPLVKVGGSLVAYKGRTLKDELKASERAFDILGLKTKTIAEYNISEDEKHFILVCEKIKHTPSQYPRGGNKPKTQPL